MRLLEKRERDACVCIRQSEDQPLCEKRVCPCDESICPFLGCRRVGIHLVARSDPMIVLSAQVGEKTSKHQARTVVTAKLCQVPGVCERASRTNLDQAE